MEKGPPTYSAIGQSQPHISGDGMTVTVDIAAVISAIKELTDAVKAIKPEVRVDLPSMNPTINLPELQPIIDIHPSAVPVSVTMPEFPPIPSAEITVNPSPVINVPVWMVPAIFVSIVLGSAASSAILDFVHAFLTK